MKTFQIRITKEGKHRCLKFKSELPMESVLAAVKAVVKNTYHVSIKEIYWRVPEDRDIMWAIKEASSIRFYHKVWKEIITEVPVAKLVGSLLMPKGTKVESNVTENTFFNIQVPTPWCIKLDTTKASEQVGVDIYHTNDGIHKFYLIGKYKIVCDDKLLTKSTLIKFYKLDVKYVVTGEMVTEEL